MGEDWTKEELEENFIGKMKAVTIAVNHVIDGRQKIICLGELETILKKAKIISQGTCYCRDRMKNCIEPMDGCLGIDAWAREAIKNGDREITQKEALEAMKRTHEAGLVHMAYADTHDGKITQICSCCSCCCHTLGAIRKMGYSNQIFESKFTAALDTGKCKNCGACVKACHFEARRMNKKKLVVDTDKCFGCGVCSGRCPEGAINMVSR
jgi:ferredoxin